jgi:hypothetical protein
VAAKSNQKQAAPREFKPTNAQRALVKKLSGYGIPQDSIRALIVNSLTGEPISLPTLHKNFRTEIDRGMVDANQKVIGALYKSAIGGNVTAQIFWAKTRCGYREKVEVGMPMPIEPLQEDSKKHDVLDIARRIAYTLYMGGAALAGGAAGAQGTR